jgi:hypothetical protein
LSPTLEFEEHMGLSFMYFHSIASNFTAFHAFSGGFLASEVTTFNGNMVIPSLFVGCGALFVSSMNET